MASFPKPLMFSNANCLPLLCMSLKCEPIVTNPHLYMCTLITSWNRGNYYGSPSAFCIVIQYLISCCFCEAAGFQYPYLPLPPIYCMCSVYVHTEPSALIPWCLSQHSPSNVVSKQVFSLLGNKQIGYNCNDCYDT